MSNFAFCCNFYDYELPVFLNIRIIPHRLLISFMLFISLYFLPSCFLSFSPSLLYSCKFYSFLFFSACYWYTMVWFVLGSWYMHLMHLNFNHIILLFFPPWQQKSTPWFLLSILKFLIYSFVHLFINMYIFVFSYSRQHALFNILNLANFTW